MTTEDPARTDNTDSSTQENSNPRNGPVNDWNTIRKSWLTPTNLNHLPSSSSSTDPNNTINAQERTVKRLEKINQMLVDYDQSARLGHPTPKPMLNVINFADRLTNQAHGHPRRIPLSQAVSMLYRSWFHDGTIPDSFPFHLEKMKDANDTEPEPQE
ncbi:hypothetical protein MJO28_005707 [Puccinia striiformis f. sp. tritici]|uniref:Uncharacterized protein n=2 Tax=Puccinia striiformis TaxID=27350 RepID=A0A2S4UFZ8_9BASI|nr:uncharacterized protein Pst134EA_032793 [Puccinia striiformis f. sp. tritici]KAI9612114.1 hypothetical protein H4Q26_008206 [Puccinia striiformis f. sp. tritici PST-130]POV96157.1 hypothetical protein PSTT_15807 [Puccinia striiformis]KAH9443519.1 hypothetical protein Pst134EA_032793 [Puccinia striiformis f. sp. tritici]KAH9458630.1 hypothetical protein Pst134EB_010929 [Puccinia striiformis f. sp. tritici]KAI7955307.1 hypothetical protein MJO28_005707 [Puccinia striiformis f. sp. tritici]